MKRPVCFRLASIIGVACAILACGCGGSGKYVWIHDLPPHASVNPDFVIQDGDGLDIRVFSQEAMSTHARVRNDGRIAMPVLGDIEVRGKRPADVKSELEARLKDYVNTPSVTVTVAEFRPFNVVALGEVARQGVIALDHYATLAEVIALAGGLTDYASRSQLFVVRTTPERLRARFTFDELLRGDPRVASFVLRPGDLIVAE